MSLFRTEPDQTWLFCMTHPDDEISICAFMRMVARNGGKIFVSWTHSNPVREQEARSAMKLIGIPEQNLIFFNAPDGKVCENLDALVPRFESMMVKVQPDFVVCGAFEQGHIDHDSTNFIVNQTFAGTVLEVPLYNTYTRRVQTLNRFAGDPEGEILLLSNDDIRFKKNFARQYPSQTIWKILFWHQIYTTTLLRPARLYATERLRVQTHKDWLKPNQSPAVASRVTQSEPWRRWTQCITEYQAKVPSLKEEIAIG
ncbi:hypothetical protein BH11ARM1_BH11ARM1_08390 [soil metagenome]